MRGLYANIIASSRQTGAAPLPNIVTTNLVFWLDGSVGASYNGAGSTWNDLSGQGLHMTLNGPTYNSSAKWFNFDGVNDYAFNGSCGNQFQFGTGDWSIEYWIQDNGNIPSILDNRTNSTSGQFSDFINSQTLYYWYINTTGYRMTNNLGLNTFKQIVITKTSNLVDTYINGVYQYTRISSPNASGTSSNLWLGRNYVGSYSAINLGIVRVYKGYQLTAAEVLQNFNAQKDEYGL